MGVLLQVEYARPHPPAANYERTQDLVRLEPGNFSALADILLTQFRWEASMMVMTVVLNIGLTIAIAARIVWKYRLMSSAMPERTQGRHEYLVWLIVESGMIVAVTQILVIILAAVGSAGYQIVVHAVNPLIVSFPKIFRTNKLPGSHKTSCHVIRESCSRALLFVSRWPHSNTIPLNVHRWTRSSFREHPLNITNAETRPKTASFSSDQILKAPVKPN